MCLVAQSCPTLCSPMDCSPPGSYVHGILQARILSGLSCPPPGDLPNPGTEPTSPIAPAWPLDSLLTEPSGSPLSLFTSLPNLQTARSCYSQGAIVENPLREKEIIQSLFQGYHVAFCLGNFYFILSFSGLLILPSTVLILLISQSIDFLFSYQNFILNIS